jgi:hypothetical protein
LLCCPPAGGQGHGYHVLGILAGSFGGAANDRGRVTGMFPARLGLKAIDIAGFMPLPVVENRILAAVRAAPGNVVVNTSLGHDCQTPVLGALVCNEAVAERRALNWIEKVRGSASLDQAGAGLENKFVHASAAGNDGVRNAHLNSSWNAARLLPGLVTLLGDPVPNLTNVLVVENRQYSVFGPTAFQPLCLLGGPGGSSTDGDVSAIGSWNWSFGDASSSADFRGGTSMASPQTAGLAAYVWALAPSLPAWEVAAIVRGTARTPECAAGAPVIDAYDALLAVDDAAALASSGNAGLAPVRSAVLDIANSAGDEALDAAGAPVAGDRRFDDRDLTLFTDRFDDPAAGVARDYSRADLNGDGSTGGSGTDAFDLDMDGSRTRVEQEIDDVPVVFDESALTDLQILCYYAYSHLYEGGDPSRRQTLLGLERCLRLELEASFPGALAPGEDGTLSVRAVRADLVDPATGDRVPQPGIHLELAVSGGTIADASGVTGADGTFETSAEIAAGSADLRIEISAVADPAGAVLARETVVAVAAGPRVVTQTITRDALTQCDGVNCVHETVNNRGEFHVAATLRADGSIGVDVTVISATSHSTSYFPVCLTEGSAIAHGGPADAGTSFAVDVFDPGRGNLTIYFTATRTLTISGEGCAVTGTFTEPSSEGVVLTAAIVRDQHGIVLDFNSDETFGTDRIVGTGTVRVGG